MCLLFYVSAVYVSAFFRCLFVLEYHQFSSSLMHVTSSVSVLVFGIIFWLLYRADDDDAAAAPINPLRFARWRNNHRQWLKDFVQIRQDKKLFNLKKKIKKKWIHYIIKRLTLWKMPEMFTHCWNRSFRNGTKAG